MTNKRILVLGGLAGALGLAAGFFVLGQLRAVSAEEAPGRAVDAVKADAPSKVSLGQALVVVEAVKAQPVREVLRINGKLALNAMRVQLVSSRVAGRVEKIMVFEGATVRAGEALALLYSPEYVSAQNEFILARNTVRVLGSKSTADLLEDAKITLSSARNRLRVLGVSEQDITALDQTGVIQPHLVIRAPISGRLIKRNVDPGGYLDTATPLGTVADLSALWFLGNAYEADFNRLREGQAADLAITGQPGVPLRGRISFIAPTIDPQTHTATVRMDLPNKDGLLKPDMFAQAEIAVGQRMLPVVPRAAVVQDGADSFVIVQRAEGRFERVPVTVIPADERRLAVTSGVKDGDRVVMEGGVLVERSLTMHPQADKAPAHKTGAHTGAGS